jgi:uncharacterized integral membrane protein
MAREAAARGDAAAKRERTRMIVGAALGALTVIFAVLNFDEVDVNWIIGTWSTPLIVVIAVSVLLGAGADRAMVRRRRKRRVT